MSAIGKILLITLSTLAIHFFFYDFGTAQAQGESCDALSEEDCAGVNNLPTADACEEDSCSCAQQMVCFLGNENAVDEWPIVPGGEQKFNDLFFHKRFAQTQISPDQLETWENFTNPQVPTGSFPDGTIIIKPA